MKKLVATVTQEIDVPDHSKIVPSPEWDECVDFESEYYLPTIRWMNFKKCTDPDIEAAPGRRWTEKKRKRFFGYGSTWYCLNRNQARTMSQASARLEEDRHVVGNRERHGGFSLPLHIFSQLSYSRQLHFETGPAAFAGLAANGAAVMLRNLADEGQSKPRPFSRFLQGGWAVERLKDAFPFFFGNSRSPVGNQNADQL
jgi:hypothetical protein